MFGAGVCASAAYTLSLCYLSGSACREGARGLLMVQTSKSYITFCCLIFKHSHFPTHTNKAGCLRSRVR